MISKSKNYLISSFLELKKVTWPKREVAVRITSYVIVCSLLLGVFINLLDFGWKTLLNKFFIN